MSNPIEEILTPKPEALFGRVVSILEQARGSVVRAVNTNMVLAYWLIGREIVEAVQGGEARAAYGKKVVEDLSGRLTERYGKGFSVTNLWYFRQFYLAFADRLQILHPSGGESSGSAIPHPIGVESTEAGILSPAGRDLTASPHAHPASGSLPQAFSPQLSWSHYRALMRVDNTQARDFYEREAIECGWSKVQLERQIHSFYYDRIVANRGANGLLKVGQTTRDVKLCIAVQAGEPEGQRQ